MANQVTVANLNPLTFVDSSSRYTSSTVLYYGTDNLITFTTYKKHKYPASPTDKFYQITKGTEYRPDLVAYKAYGIPSLWWRLMEANGMMDILEFKAGVTIRIPNSIS